MSYVVRIHVMVVSFYLCAIVRYTRVCPIHVCRHLKSRIPGCWSEATPFKEGRLSNNSEEQIERFQSGTARPSDELNKRISRMFLSSRGDLRHDPTNHGKWLNDHSEVVDRPEHPLSGLLLVCLMSFRRSMSVSQRLLMISCFLFAVLIVHRE